MAADATAPLTLLTGPAGSGRTTALARLAERTARAGGVVSGTRFTPTGEALPTRFALRADGPAALVPDPSAPGAPWSPVGPAPGGRTTPATADRAATAAVAPLLRTGRGVLLVDDAQWADPDALAVLAAVARRLAGSAVRCVCAVRTPTEAATPEVLAAVRELRANGLLDAVRLPPLAPDAVTGLLTESLRATPEPDLVDRVLAATRGVPGPVRHLVGTLRAGGSVGLVDRWAYLVRPFPPHVGSLVRAVRDRGPAVWAAAGALAVLHPLGPAVPDLVAEALGTTGTDAAARLDDLLRAGVVHRGLRGASWRFTVPLVADAVLAELGPYERARAAAVAVTALWAGRVRCPDQGYLAEQVARADGLVDAGRAAGVLLEHVGGPGEADRLAVAAALLPGGSRRSAVLLRRAVACHADGDHTEGLRLAGELLADRALPPADLQQANATAVRSLRALGDTRALRAIADGGSERPDVPGHEPTARAHAGTHPSPPHTLGHDPVTRALALSSLDRWPEVADLLADTAASWRVDNPVSAALGADLLAAAELWCGRPGPRDDDVAALLVAGDDTAPPHGTAPPRTGTPDERALRAALRGDVDVALDTALRAAAAGVDRREPAHTALRHAAAGLLLARGRPATARALLRRDGTTPLDHLLALGEAEVSQALGDRAGAVVHLRAALAAEDRGVLVGLDLAWSELAHIAAGAGDRAAATRVRRGAERVAAALGTGRAELHALLTRAIVNRDPTAAAACLARARERSQPAELAKVIRRLVGHGVADPALLGEAYHALGDLGALLHRSWTRDLMRARGVTVPGRRETLEEGDVLLARLTAGGLSNSELAAVLRTSAKAVEGRLGRLFARTGHRSRIGLSTAVLGGGRRP